MPAGQRDDRGRHGGREQHGLPQLGSLRQDALDIGQEAEVEHLVRLVQHQHLDVAEVERAAVRQVEQPSWCADHDLGSAGEAGQLGVVADPAVDGQHPGVPAGRGGGDVGADLAGQLPGGRHHQSLRCAGLGQMRVVPLAGHHDPLQHRDPERQRLAGAGSSLTDHVRAGQGDRDGHRLDRERMGDADLLQGLDDRTEYAEITEGRGAGGIALVGRGGFGSQNWEGFRRRARSGREASAF